MSVQPEPRLSSEARVWFVSDVHIVYGDEPYLNQFIRFLEATKDQIDALYIHGDLFEFWIGDRQRNFEFYRPLFAAFSALGEQGIKLYFIHGNRDFLIGKRFEECGGQLLPDAIDFELGDFKVHLSHGDEYCLDDLSYQRARKVMRSAPLKFVAKSLPAFLGVFLAQAYRKISEKKKAKKKRYTGNRYHTIEKGVHAELNRNDCDVLICGHIHFLQDFVWEGAGKPRRIITTGAWEEGPNFVAFDGRDFALMAFDSSTGIAQPALA